MNCENGIQPPAFDDEPAQMPRNRLAVQRFFACRRLQAAWHQHRAPAGP